MRESEPMNGHLDEGTVHAWLDGALAGPAASRVEAHVASCGACAGLVAEARGLIAGSTRILAALDDVPGDVVPRERGADDAGGTGGRYVSDGGAAPRAPVVGGAREARPSTGPRGAARWRWVRDPRAAVAAALLLVAVGVGRSDLYSRRAEVASSALARLSPAVVWAAPAPGEEPLAVARAAAPVPAAIVAMAPVPTVPPERAAAVAPPVGRGELAASVTVAAPLAAPVVSGAAVADVTARQHVDSTVRALTLAGGAYASMAARSEAQQDARAEALAGATLRRSMRGEAKASATTAANAAPPSVASATAPTVASGVASGAVVSDMAMRAGAADATARKSAGGRTLSGVVVDVASAAPIAGVQLQAVGTALATTTDSAGRFVLPGVPDDDVRLRARRIGYRGADTTLRAVDAGALQLALGRDVLRLESQVVREASAAEAPGPCYTVRRGRGASRALPRVVTLGAGSASPGATSATREPLAGDSVLVRIGGAELRLVEEGARLRGTVTDSTGARGRIELRRTSCPAR